MQFFHSAHGYRELLEVVVEGVVVTVGEIKRGKVGLHQWSVVQGHFHEVQHGRDNSCPCIDYPECLLECAIYPLGLTVGLWVERT